MELYHNNMSVCAQKVRLVLAQKQLHPVEHHLNLRAGDATRPAYLRLNPNGVIPTLIDQGAVIIESSIICEYLDDAYPEESLRPADNAERAHMRVWTQLPDASLHHACGVLSFAIAFRHQMLALPKEEIDRQLAEKPDPKVRDNLRQTIDMGIDAPMASDALKNFDGVIGRIASRLDQAAWLAGDSYSLADIAMLPYVCRLENLGMSWIWSGRRSAIDDWLSRCKARANFSGISSYLDPQYLQLLERCGRELTPRLRAVLAH
jgi:glutathione S-transferase